MEPFSISAFDETKLPPINQWIEDSGYSANAFHIKLQWVENTGKNKIYGVLVNDPVNNEDREIYFNEQGQKIDNLQEYNIQKKNWSPDYVDIPTGFPDTKSITTQKKALVSTKGTYLKISSYTFNLPLPEPYITDSEHNNYDEKGLLEIGKVVDLLESMTLFGEKSSVDFETFEVEDDIVQSLNFFAENAVGMKIHLVFNRTLPPMHNLYIRSDDANSEIMPVLLSKDDVWSPLIASSKITLYYIKPKSSYDDFIPITIDRYAYIYKDPVEELAKVGTCYEDVMCYDSWKDISRGVMGLSKVSSNNVIFCTGSLLNDGKPEQISHLVLTAFHCVGSVSTAESLDFYWLYQSESCGGSIPVITTVSKTSGGADFLVGSPTDTGTDMSLLRIKDTPPTDIPELGFTNIPVPVGTNVVAIHHPRDTYKRISFASTTNTGSPKNRGENLRPLDRYHEVVYDLSSTESGSSGCPLFREDTQQIIGQLWGGSAGCSDMKEPDYYGRLDISYPLIEPYIFVFPEVFDVDGSGIIDNEDLNFVINALLGANTRTKSDLNNDGWVDACDIQVIQNQISSMK
ncbi:MAG TPA: trypsin-like peptidase domain-containing protein [Candidatus Hydrogenedens sp.]|nr:trypsin-like peptidase domain-containing protein [Candidatus Hydrogenedens sp.]